MSGSARRGCVTATQLESKTVTEKTETVIFHLIRAVTSRREHAGLHSKVKKTITITFGYGPVGSGGEGSSSLVQFRIRTDINRYFVKVITPVCVHALVIIITL